jgi:serine/threonine protein kinase
MADEISYVDNIKLKYEKNASHLSLDDFIIKNLIGRGNFGQVYLVEHNSINFAMKVIKKDVVLQESEGILCAKLERDVMKFGQYNPFLAKIYCTFHTDDHLCFVMEFLNGGDLMYHMMLSQTKFFDENRARFYSIQVACAIQYLHSKNIVYRDLKLDNILLDSEGHCKIADFGMSKSFDLVTGKTRTFCGTPDYIAPEVRL